MINQILFFLSMPYVQNALIVGILIALCSSLLGVTLVLKRFSFIGDGLSHVAFGALAIAMAMKITNTMWIVLPVTVVTAILLLMVGQNTRIKGDASLAMISVGALALGYMISYKFPSSANFSGDVCSTLFGSASILTLKDEDIWLCAGMSVLVILLFLIFYRQIFAVTFDENFATATGVRAKLYNLLIAVITALVIVVAMNLVGSLLISALVIFPALSSMRIFKNFKSVILCSAVIATVAAFLGIILSMVGSGAPVGSSIVAVNIAIFLIFSLIGRIFGGK